MAVLLPVALGVTLRGGGPEVGGLTSTEQLERAVRDINRLEATIESALPAYLRPASPNASQIWSPLDEEQQREEEAVNAAVAAAAQEEAKAREQLAAARAQAAAVGARRHVRRFASAGSFGFGVVASPPASSPAAAPPAAGEDPAQVAQKLALEAQEAGRAALHAASLAMRMASLPTGAGAPSATPVAGLGTSLPLPLTQWQPTPTPRAEAPAEAAHIGEALAFEKPAAATPPPTAGTQPPPEAPSPAETTTPPLAPRETSSNQAAIAAMRRAAGSWLPLSSSPGAAPLPSPLLPAVSLRPSARADTASTPPRTGASAGWMVRVALWCYLFVLGVVLCAVVVYGVARAASLAANAVRRLLGRPEEPQEPPVLDASALGLGLADGLSQAYGVGGAAPCTPTEGGAGVSVPTAEVPGRPKLNTPGYKPPPSAHGQQVMDLLRSGKQNFSVSESKAVANFLARQKDLLILCGDKKGGDK